MKKTIIFAIMSILIITSFALATRYEQNIFRFGIIQSDGSLTESTTPVTGVSIAGFVCNSANCNTVSSQMWNGATLFTNSDSITLEFPTVLQSSFGYGIIMYKDGYIPYEVTADYAGTDTNPVGPFTDYLTKKNICSSPLTNLIVAQNGTRITVTGTANAPITENGPVHYTPASLIAQYSTDVTLTLNVNSSTSNYNVPQVVSIPFSQQKTVSFTLDVVPGNYTLNLQSLPTDQKCISASLTTLTNPTIISVTNTTTNATNVTNGTSPIALTINSPLPITYNITSVPLDITAINATLVMYSLDGAPNITYTMPAFLNVQNGTHNLNVYASNTFGETAQASVAFIVNTSAIQNVTNSTNSTNSTIPSISNLQLISRTNTSLTWSWVNPSSSNFSNTIIYLDGINVMNGSINTTTYTASNLTANTAHTLTINTQDIFSNINRQNISSTGTTLSNTNTNTNPTSGGHSKTKKVYTNLTDESTSPYIALRYLEDNNSISLGYASNPVKNTWNIWIFLLGTGILLLILLIILIVLIGQR